jgi:hypothetical protein
MPKVSYHKEARLRSIIRDAMAVDPLISIPSLQAAIEAKIHRTIQHNYLSKLIKSVSGEMKVVMDREKVEDRIEYLRETNRVLRDELLRIAFPNREKMPQPTESERLRAIELISKIDREQVKIEMDLGLFTRHLGTLDIDHRLKPLEDDTRSSIVGTFKMWGIAPPQTRKIEPQQALPPQTPIIANEPEIKQPAPEPKKPEPAGPITGRDLQPA